MPRDRFTRLLLLALLLGLECLVRSSLPHTETSLAPIASFGIAAFAVFLGLGYATLQADRQALPFHTGLFGAHIGALSLLCAESAAAATGHEPALSPALLLIARAALTLITVLLLALALLPPNAWVRLWRATRLLWLYAALAGALTWLLRSPLQSLWTSQDFLLGHWLQSATFASVAHLLTPVVPGIDINASAYILSAPNFAIYVAPACSGLEGLGLVLVFTLAWLAWFRREFRFPHALLLVPAALVAVWVLNVFRIAALMLIGNAGYSKVAMTGFHSQAGWIAFTLVALTFSIATRHLRWVQQPGVATLSPVSAPASAKRSEESASSPAYLLPFLAILASSFLTRAASGSFEWLYPLRLIAGLLALWAFRRTWRTLDLHFHWSALPAGLAVALLWIVPALAHAPEPSAVAQGLAELSPSARVLWILLRIAAAVLTVPFAEELAFRGFLVRRLRSRAFDALPYAQLTIVPIALASLAFGLLHGQHWIAGTLAGIVFSLLARSRNRLGDAVAAHATANLLLAIFVLVTGNYSLW